MGAKLGLDLENNNQRVDSDCYWLVVKVNRFFARR